MSKNPPSFQLPLDDLPVADDLVATDLDLRLSTPSTVVVDARLEVEAADASGPGNIELALVIPRSQCRGERPLLAALLDAARTAIARATRAGTTPLTLLPRRVVAQAAGRPYVIPVF